MAVTVKLFPTAQKKEISFPCLLKDKYSKLVVLFSSPNGGTVIIPEYTYKCGLHMDSWEDADGGTWIHSDPVTIEND